MSQGMRAAIMVAMVLVFGGLLISWAMVNQRAVQLPMPGWLAQGHDRVITRLDHRLFVLMADGTETPYQQPQAGWHYNGLSLVNEDVLLWRRAKAPGLFDSLLRLFRVQPRSTAHEAPGELIRCAPGVGHCSVVPIPMTLDRAFHMVALPHSDHILLADTANHRLVLLDAAGAIVDQVTELRFPNLPLVYGDSVWVPDTNNHRLIEFRPDESGIGPVMRTIDIPVQGEWRWPTAIVPVNEGWWVLVGDMRLMRDRILVFDQDWQYQRHLDLTGDANLESMALLGDMVLVSDVSQRQILGLDHQGVIRGIWQGEPLYQELQALQRQATRLQGISHALIAVFAVLLLPAFWLAWKLDGRRFIENQKQASTLFPDANQELAASLPEQPLWAAHSKILGLRWLFLLAPLPMLLVIQVGRAEEMLMVAPLALVMVSVFFWFNSAAGSAVGVGPDGVMLRDYRGRVRVGRGQQLVVGRMTLAIGDVLVHVGSAGQPLFDQSFLKQVLGPHLVGATRESGMEELRRVWRSDHQPLRLQLVVLPGVALALLLVLMLGF